MEDAEFSPETGVGWTAVGMVGAEEDGNAMARLFILIVTSNRRRGHDRILGGIVGGGGMLPAERQ